MFPSTITVRGKDHIKCGTTSVPHDRTFGQVMALFKKMGCSKVMFMGEGDQEKFAFELDGIPYLITVPRVFFKNPRRGADIYQERIGIRIVFWFLDSFLPLIRERVIDPSHLLAAARVVMTPDGPMSLGDALETLPPADIFPALGPAIHPIEVERK